MSEDDDDSRYNMDSDDDSDMQGKSYPQDQRFTGYGGFSSPENDVADDRFSIDGEDMDDDDDDDTGRHSALSLDVTERMSNRMYESGGTSGRVPPREAFTSHLQESDRSSLMGGVGDRPDEGRKRGRQARGGGMLGLDDGGDGEDDFVYYEGARKKNKLTFAKARPTIRAILLTVALLLSTYVVLGCNFITVNVGFVPENLAVEPTFDLGLWSYPPSATGEKGSQCLKYPDAFTKEYVTWDGRWVFARSSSLLVILLGWISLILAWLLAIKRPRLKPTLKYKIALAFLAGLMLLFQCFTFVFLQISLCTDEVWVHTSPHGKALRYRAESCKLSSQGNMAIGSLVLYFVLVVALCQSRMREQMEHNVKAAGKKAAQLHYSNMHRRRSSANYVDDDDDELESLGFGEEEKQADMDLDKALSMLESRRFDYAPSSAMDDEMESIDRSGTTGSVSTLTQSASFQSMGGHSSGNFGGLETLNEEDEEESPSEDTDFEDVPIDQDRGLTGASKSWHSDRSGMSSAMSGYS